LWLSLNIVLSNRTVVHLACTHSASKSLLKINEQGEEGKEKEKKKEKEKELMRKNKNE
jgi:hypothetical protein